MSWNNAGTIDAANATVSLNGTFTLANVGTFHRSGGTVSIVGTLDNTGTTLALDAATGSWSLSGGTIKGGTVTATGGAALLLPGGILDGVTLATALFQNTGRLDVKHGLTLSNATLTATGSIYFQGTQTLGGTGQVLATQFWVAARQW